MLEIHGFKAVLLVPGKDLAPSERYIIAKVSDGNETFTYKFGRNQSLTHVWQQLPKLYMDERFERKIRERYKRRKKVA